MGGKSGSAPDPVDPAKGIAAQKEADTTAFNQQTTANRTNTSGPDGSVTWSSTPTFDQAGYNAATADWKAQNGAASGIPQPGTGDFTSNTWTQNTQLTPAQQQLHDLNQSSSLGQANLLGNMTDQLAQTYANPLDFSGVNSLTSSVQGGAIQNNAGVSADQAKLEALDPKQYAQDAADASYNNSTRYLDPQIAVQQKALEARLGEQGMVPGTPGYQAAMQQFQNTNAQSYQAARDSATLQGAQVGSQQFQNSTSALNSAIAAALQGGTFSNAAQKQNFDQGVSNAALNNSVSSQQIAQLLQERAAPLDELNALRNGTAADTSQAAGQTGNASLNAPDITGALNNQYQQKLNQYNAGVSSDNANTQAATGLASSAMLAYLAFLA